jgi:hypothetical protein
LLSFALVKKLIRFLGNSAIGHWNLAWRVSGLEKYSFFNPRLHTFSPSPKIVIFERGFTCLLSQTASTASGFQPLLKVCSRAYARHPWRLWRHFPPDPPFRQPLLCLTAKSTIKPSPAFFMPQNLSSGFMYSQAWLEIIEISFADFVYL